MSLGRSFDLSFTPDVPEQSNIEQRLIMKWAQKWTFLVVMAMGVNSYAKNVDDGEDILVPSQQPKRVVHSQTPKRKMALARFELLNEVDSMTQSRIEDMFVRTFNSGSIEFSRLDLPSVTQVPPAIDQEAEAIIAQGESALSQMQFGEAQKLFERAVVNLQNQVAHLRDVSLLRRAYLNLAEAALRSGNQDEVGRAFASMIALDASYNLDKDVFPSSFVGRYNDLRKALLAQPSASLVVENAPAHSVVLLDGKSLGPAPLKISDVTPGTHLLLVESPHRKPFGQVIHLGQGQSVRISPLMIEPETPVPTISLSLNQMPGSSDLRKIAEYARQRGLDGIVVGGLVRSRGKIEVALLVVDAKSAQAARLPQMELDTALLNIEPEGARALAAIEDVYRQGAFAKSTDVAPLFDASLLGHQTPPSEVKMTSLQTTMATTIEENRASKRIVLALQQGGAPATLMGVERQVEVESKPSWFWPVIIGGSLGALAVGGLALGGVMYFSKPSLADVNVRLPN
jgi:hypothetical protein